MHRARPNIRRWFVFKRPLTRRTTFLLAVLLILALLHAAILRMLAWPLEAAPSSTSAAYYCLRGDELDVDGFEPFDHAAAWHAEAPGRKILLLPPPDSRIVEIGAVRSFEQTCRNELDKRRIPPSDVVSTRTETRDVWGEARAVADWSKKHPGATVVLACSPLSSGRLRYVLNKVLGPADAARVRLAWLPEPGTSIDSWWRSRRGVKTFMYAWLEMIYAWAEGDDSRPVPAGAAAFQQAIRARIGEAPP
jgi:hypothetical protein